MASEHEEDRDQQLKALRRHMVRLDSQWEPPTELGVKRERLGDERAGRGRPPLRWLLIVGLLVAVALAGGVVVGAVAWSDNRPAREAAETTSPTAARSPDGPPVAAVATPACKTAVDRANAMLASAVKLRGALAERDRILNDPANRGLSVAQVLERLAASERADPGEAARFDNALDAYRQVVDQCDLRVP
ncbi:MAG TPA: hypothetical protein VID07_03355 [Actinomycetes bacterium]|jgi:hypothetical protein